MTRRWMYVVFIPIIVGSVAFLGYSSFMTTFNFDIWGLRSIVDSTYLVAREKAKRIEQKIIDSDNAILNLVDMENLEDLRERWAALSGVSHAVDSVFIIDENGSVIFSVSDYTDGDFERLSSMFQDVVVPQLELKNGRTQTLRHYHFKYEGKYYLISYKSRKYEEEWYTVCLNYNLDLIVSDFLPELFSDLGPDKICNMVDTEGNLIYGSRIKEAGEFIVGWKIPSTLYEWRIQIAPTKASFFEATSRKKHLYDSITVLIAFGVLFLAIGMIIYMAEQERRLAVLKEEFITNVSHELRTPLGIIQLYNEMLALGKVKEPEKEKKYIQIIAREGERLGALLDTILDFARSEKGKMSYDHIVGDVTPSVIEAIENSRTKFEQENIQIEVKVGEGIPPVKHDPHAITLMVMNLLDNAIKYAEGTDKVVVEIGKMDDMVAISVIDWGPGIPKSEQKHIFERFYRGKDARKKHRRGTGIGLSLVKSIVESHGGIIKLISPIDDSGRGTRFTIMLKACLTSS